MRLAAVLVLLLGMLALPRPAGAYEEKFHGWSSDGAWYVDSWSGTDEFDRYRLCVTEGDAVPASWPAKMPHPEEGSRCAELCNEMGGDCIVDEAQIARWVVQGSAKSPAGERVTVKYRKTTVVVTVASKATLEEAELELFKDWHPRRTRIEWSPSGTAVAVSLYDDPLADPPPGYGPPTYVAVLTVSPLAGEVRKVIDPTAREVRIKVAANGASAWASYEARGKRVTDVVVKVDGAWKVVTSFASAGMKDKAAHAAAAAGKLPLPPTTPGEDAPAALAAAFRCDTSGCDEAARRDDMTVIGSAPGERSLGGEAWARAWQGWSGRSRVLGSLRGGLAPGGGVGWIVADVAVSYPSGKKPYEIPFRVFVVYERSGSDWTTAAAHVAIAR